MAQPLDYAPPAARRPFPIRRVVWTLVAVAVVGLLTSLWMIHANRPRDEPVVLRCSSNLMQIYEAMVLYSDDFHGAAAPDFATLTASEVLLPEVFICYDTADTRSTAATQSTQLTADLTPGSGHCSYVYVRPVGRFDKIPPDALLAYEPPSNHPDLTWANVLLGDGRVERVDVPQLDALIAAQHAGTWPLRVTMQPSR